jgi:hypothetical protein
MAVPTKKLLTPDEVRELNDTLRYHQGDESEQGRREYARIRAQLKRLSHDETCSTCQALPPEHKVTSIDVPLDAQGKRFRINGTEFFGPVMVPACQGSILLHMIDQNRQETLRHTESISNNVFLGQMGDRARSVQG